MQESTEKDHWRLPILVLAPILVALIHDDWLFSPVGFPDPYFNVGFFLHYFDPSFLSGMYKEARVPWLAPGYFAYHAIGPMAANFVLHVGSIVGAVALVYSTLSRLISRNAAFLAAAMICVYYQFQGGGTAGWDYQTTPSGLFYALTLYLLVRAAQTQYPAFWLGAAGMAFGATVHANIICVNLSLGVAMIYLAAATHKVTPLKLGKAVGWALLGFVLLTMICSIVAWDAGRDPIFFRSVFNLAASFTVDPTTHQQRWWQPWSNGWFLQPLYLSYLLPLAAIFLASLAWLINRVVRYKGAWAQSGNGVVHVVLVGQYVLAAVIWLVWQTQGQTALQPDCFAYPLIIPAFMALGAMLGPVSHRQLIAFGLSLVIVVVALACMSHANDNLAAQRVAVGVVTLAFVAAMLAGAFTRFGAIAVISAGTVYLIAYPVMALTHQASQPLWSEFRRDPRQCFSPKMYFSETVRLSRTFRRPGESKVWVWDGPDDVFKAAQCGVPVEYFRTTLMATGFDGLGSYHASADQMDDSEIRLARTGDRIMAIVEDKAGREALVARFQRANRYLALQSEQQIRLGRAQAWITIYAIR